MAPQHTPVITGSASRDAAIGLESRWTSAVAASLWARLAGAEKFLVCNELRCLPKDRPLPQRALYGERSECDDQPQRSGYVQVARVDSSPGKWWVWSEFLLRARRGNEADRRRDANLSAVQPEAAHRVSAHNAYQPIEGRTTYTTRQAPYGAAPTARLTRVAPGWGHARQHSLEEGNNERQSRSD